jgi:hypothetical protein
MDQKDYALEDFGDKKKQEMLEFLCSFGEVNRKVR